MPFCYLFSLCPVFVSPFLCERRIKVISWQWEWERRYERLKGKKKWSGFLGEWESKHTRENQIFVTIKNPPDINRHEFKVKLVSMVVGFLPATSTCSGMGPD